MKSRFRSTLIALLLGSALGPAAHGQQTNEWKVGFGKWEIGSNWTLGVPVEFGDIEIGPGAAGAGVITIDSATVLSNAINECMTIDSLTVKGTATESRFLSIDTANSDVPLAITRNLIIQPHGGILVSNAIVSLGLLATLDDDNSVTIDGGGEIITTNAVIGSTGAGNFTIGNGMWISGLTQLGLNSGSQGTLTLSGEFAFMRTSDQLILGVSTNSTGTVWIIDGILVTQLPSGEAELTTIGAQGSGQMTVSNGGTWFGGSTTLGGSAGGQGTLTLAGGTMSVTAPLDEEPFVAIGNGGSGAFWMTGGQLIGPNNQIFVGGGGPGQMTVSNGTAQTFDLFLGIYEKFVLTLSAGTLTMAGGIVTVSDIMAVELGTVWVTGGQLITSKAEIADQMTVSNGTWQAESVFLTSSFGTRGTINLAGGTNTIGMFDIGTQASATGTVWMTGGQLNTTGGTTQAGLFDGLGQIVVSNGLWSAGEVDLGAAPGSHGILTMVGGQLTATNVPGPIVVGANGVGHMTMLNGGVLAGSLYVGFTNSSLGELVMNGGSVTVLGNLTIGNCDSNGFGVVEMTGGTLYVTNAAHNAVLDLDNGIFQLDGGSLVVDVLVATNACNGIFDHAGGTLSVRTVLLDPNGDTDGDGLPNGWEEAHGLDPLSSEGNNGSGGDPDGDGFSNLQEYLAGSDPQNPLSTPLQIISPFQMTSIVRQGNNVVLTWGSIGGTTNQVQVGNGSYATNAFVNLSAQLIISGSGLITTNYTDTNGATNKPARFYRIRLVP